MSLGRNIAFGLYFLTMLISVIFAALYLFRGGYMPYHAEAVATPWSKLDRKFQALFIAFLRVAGGGWLSSAMSIGFLLFIPFRRGELWANWALLAVGLTVSIPAVVATVGLKRKTSANPPWVMAVVAVFLVMAGFIMGLVFVK